MPSSSASLVLRFKCTTAEPPLRQVSVTRRHLPCAPGHAPRIDACSSTAFVSLISSPRPHWHVRPRGCEGILSRLDPHIHHTPVPTRHPVPPVPSSAMRDLTQHPSWCPCGQAHAHRLPHAKILSAHRWRGLVLWSVAFSFHPFHSHVSHDLEIETMTSTLPIPLIYLTQPSNSLRYNQQFILRMHHDNEC